MSLTTQIRFLLERNDWSTDTKRKSYVHNNDMWMTLRGNTSISKSWNLRTAAASISVDWTSSVCWDQDPLPDELQWAKPRRVKFDSIDPRLDSILVLDRDLPSVIRHAPVVLAEDSDRWMEELLWVFSPRVTKFLLSNEFYSCSAEDDPRTSERQTSLTGSGNGENLDRKGMIKRTKHAFDDLTGAVSIVSWSNLIRFSSSSF